MEGAVHLDRLARLEAELAEINRRYERLGVAPVRLIDTGRREAALAIVRLGGETQAASVGEWEVVCVLEHAAGRTVVRPCVVMSEEQRERLAGARGLCEGCRTIRARAKTYVLRDRGSGRTVQLGSSCVRPFTRAGSPQAALRRAEHLAEVRAAVANAGARRRPGPGERYIDTTLFLAHAIAEVRNRGYEPASSPAPTWAAALELLEEGARQEESDVQRASDVRRWATTRRTEEPGSYPSRRAECLEHDRLSSRELALAASTIPAYNRHLYWLIRHRHRRERQEAREEA